MKRQFIVGVYADVISSVENKPYEVVKEERKPEKTIVLKYHELEKVDYLPKQKDIPRNKFTDKPRFNHKK